MFFFFIFRVTTGLKYEKEKKRWQKIAKKKIEAILINYNIEETATNFNSITEVLLNGQKVDIYKKIIQLANYCIITDDNEESFTCEILVSKNNRLLEDIQKLFAIRIMAPLPSDFRSNLFLRIKVYKNVSK